MQPYRMLERFLARAATVDTYLFSLRDLAAVLPGSMSSVTMVASRLVAQGVLDRVCRGIYLYPREGIPSGLVLYHTAAKLRAGYFNYLSQESVLSDLGIISQIPLQRIMLMSSGRSGVIACGAWGSIEFTHTKKTHDQLSSQLTYDPTYRLLKASAALAWRDLSDARRNLDLVDKEALSEHLV